MINIYRIFFLLSCLLPFQAYAELSLPALISDNMVLQQHSRARLWGQAEPASTITTHIAGRQGKALTDAQGNWEIQMPHLPTGNHTLKIEERLDNAISSTVHIKNVAVGEVWLASGQSNMEWPIEKSASISQVPNLLQAVDLRFFIVSRQTALTPQSDVSGHWVQADTDSIFPLSAIAFHFAQQLSAQLNAEPNRQTKVAIGIIQSAWGNTKAEAWTSLEAIQNKPALQTVMAERQQRLNIPTAEKEQQAQQQLAWEAQNYQQDPGITAETQAFSHSDFDDSDWQSTELPVLFSDLKLKDDGIIWFRRTVDIPKEWENKQAFLHLGMIDDFDRVFLNGQEIAGIDRNTAHHWLQPRRYKINADLLKSGQNTLAIRVFDRYGTGGFTSLAQDLLLKTAQHALPLSGTWKYKISLEIAASQPDWASAPTPAPLYDRNTPTGLYNAMIAPLSHYTLQGVIWYQGEADATQTDNRYRTLFPTMIQQWQQAWQQSLPFLFVQLANFNLPNDESQQSWANIRAIQADTAQRLPNAGMVTAIDVGEADDIHPKNKQVIGQRLANLALATVYGRKAPWQSPECATAELTDDQSTITVHCNFADGLYSKGRISGFEIAGEDEQFYPAETVIEGTTLRVSSPHGIKKPMFIRYAWHNNPVANIYNAEALPLQPFRLGVSE